MTTSAIEESRSQYDKVWAGEYQGADGALTETWKRFESDPEKYLVQTASDFYDHRADADARRTLSLLLNPLIERAREVESSGEHYLARYETSLKAADDVDVMASILSWAARNPQYLGTSSSLGDSTLARVQTMIDKIIERALRWSGSGTLPDGTHTYALLMITKIARSVRGESDHKLSRATIISLLAAIEPWGLAAKDLNQRARVLRGIGIYWRHLWLPWHFIRGCWFGYRAVTVPGLHPRQQLNALFTFLPLWVQDWNWV